MYGYHACAHRIAFSLVALVAVACGSPATARRPAPASTDDDVAALPGPERRGLQLYLVLTADPRAMQGKAAVDAMWRAVDGDAPRYSAVRRHVRWVPHGYALDVTLDYADLPHPEVDFARLAPMLRALPPEARARAEAARLAVFVRSDANVLPSGNHIRLAGLAALYAADRWGGVILDLIARRAWTPDAWQAELAGASLSKRQVRRVIAKDEGGTYRLVTRGDAKYGVPDLQMRRVPPARLKAAEARLVEVQDAMLGGRRAPVPTSACEAPPGMFDGECAQIAAP